MKKTDVLVIGGGPAALITSTVAAQMNHGKKVIVVRDLPDVPIPCAIPYAFGQLGSIDNNIMPDKSYQANGIELIIDLVVSGDPEAKIMTLKSGEQIQFEQLVLATGSKPIKPASIEGLDQDFVYFLPKDNEYLRKFRKASETAKKITIIGGGFIGMEFADEFLSNSDKEITVIEMMDHVLIAAFDEEFCKTIEERYRTNGAKLLTKREVKRVGDHVVELADGEQIPTDLVLVAIGATPNIDLAKNMGLDVTRKGIWVDEYLRTSLEYIYAVGDCAAKTDFFTRRPTSVMLASTACAEARVAGANLFKLQVVRENKGTIGIFSTNVQGITIATAGLTERLAKCAGFDTITAATTSKDRHPGKIKDSADIEIKLVFSKNCSVLLGGQIIGGGKSVGEMINAIGIAIQQRMTVSELFTLQFGTHPLLTSSPTTYPLITAAQKALVEMKK
ncbi:MAG: FAD-dependent oxidoreductase [Candidatus Ranarchaeia archaeon]